MAEDGGGSEDYGSALLFICITMLFVVAVYEFRKFIKLPASLLLLLTGLFIRYAGVHMGLIKEAVYLWAEVDQWSILLFFLPALIFECGLSIDWYSFKRELPQIILMSTTAVLLHAYITCVVLKYILQYDFDWDQAFMIGAILSATDHVTVVSQIKELKVDKRFETLIQGECLLIDGAVMVLFFVFLKRLTGEAIEDEETATYFFRLVLGGVALGLAFSWCFTLAIRRIINDDILEVNMTILTAYLIFFTAEDSGIEVSGAIATVTFALFMSSFGKTLISPSVIHVLHGFWKIIGKNIEGLIFILAGMLLAHLSINDGDVSEEDAWKTVVLFVFLHLIRALVVLIHYPLLSRLGLGLHWKEAVVLSVTGGKGVICSSLSILLWRKEDLSVSFRDLALFIAIICSSLSILIDPFIIKATMKVLGLGQMTEIRENSFLEVTKDILEATDKTAHKLEHEFRSARWDQAQEIAGMKALINKVLEQTEHGRAVLKECPDLDHRELIAEYFKRASFDSAEVIQEVRTRTMMTLKGLYWEQFEEGLCEGSAVLKLMESSSYCMEKAAEPVASWEYTQRITFKPTKLRLLKSLSRIWGVGRFFRNAYFANIAEAYDVSSAFIKVNEEAIELMETLLKNTAPDIVEEVRSEIEKQVELAKEFRVTHVWNDCPEVVTYVQTKQACFVMLTTQRTQINSYFEKGLLEEYESQMLNAVVNRGFKKMKLDRDPDLPDAEEMLRSSILGQGVNDDDFTTLFSFCREVEFSSGDCIYEVGSSADGIFFILQGRAEETGQGWTRQYSSGEAIGEMHLLPDVLTAYTQAVAMTNVSAVFIPKSLQALFLVGDSMLKAIAVKLLASSLEELGVFMEGIKFKDIVKIVDLTKVRKYAEGSSIPMASGGFVVLGKLDQTPQSSIYFSPDVGYSRVGEDTVFLHLSTKLSNALLKSDGYFKSALRYLRMRSKEHRPEKLPAKVLDTEMLMIDDNATERTVRLPEDTLYQ
jgi:NhaP-type Na+/H+ or K+/H+ antiporter